MRLVPITQLSDAEWVAYHQMRLTSRERYQPAAAAAALKRSTEEFRKRLLTSIHEIRGAEYALLKGEPATVLGWLRFYSHTADLTTQFDFLADEIPDGFVRLVAKGMHNYFQRKRFKRAIAFSDDRRHMRAFRRMMPAQETPFLRLALDVDKVNHAQLAAWEARFEQEKQVMHLEWTENLPPQIHEDYLRLHAQFMADLPLGEQRNQLPEMTHEDLHKLIAVTEMNHHRLIVLFMVNPAGRRIGFSELTASLESGMAVQNITGILREYRGKGLATALKAAMFKRAMQEIPNIKRITTTTSPHNKTMLHINQAMGFQVDQESAQFIFYPEGIANFLNSIRNNPVARPPMQSVD